MATLTKKLEDKPKILPYNPDKKEKGIRDFVKKRVVEMKTYRQTLGVEKEWRDADREYIPSEIEFGKSGIKFEQNQDTGLRSRMVKVGDDTEDWRSKNSDPTLLKKIQTALSIIIDRNPEAVLTALLKRYEKTTALANSLWKRNFEITNAKEVYKLFAFNQFKYGWAVGRTFPKIIKYDKQILTEVDLENPENNKYEKKEIVHFNDVSRENLDPYRTWIDETSKPYDPDSMKEDYYELDYTWDAFQAEFDQYSNIKFVDELNAQVIPDDKKKDEKKRQDIVTVGFYENRLKDIYVIYIPSQEIVLYSSPLPNDDGYLSLFHGFCLIRSADNPYGLGLWQVIRQKKELYDKMNNMTMDQLVLAIMKMGFYTGTSTFEGSGKFKIIPGKVEQIIDGKVDWMNIPPPDSMAWEGLKHLASGIDDDSGINPTIEGEIIGKTLGEILHAKEASLKRIKVPLENLSEAMEWDAYITLSWMAQTYSTPEVISFSDLNELEAYEKENETKATKKFAKTNEAGEIEGDVKGAFLPQLGLHLEDRDGQLFESKESQFFQVGEDIQVAQLKWKGIFRIIPKSLLSPSAELEKQRKMELYNVIVPVLTAPPELFLKPTMQILKVNEEDPDDWLPDTWLQIEKEQDSLFVKSSNLPTQQGVAGAQGQTMQGQAGMTPQRGQTVVPQGQIGSPQAQGLGQKLRGALRGTFRK